MKQKRLRYLSWEHYNSMVKEIIKKLKKEDLSGFEILAIPRGGCVLGVHLSNLLGIPVKFFVEDKAFLKKLSKNLLIVDDISDSGDTLIRILNFLTITRSDLNIKIVTLHRRCNTKLLPDYYIQDAKKYWIVYPWEVI